MMTGTLPAVPLLAKSLLKLTRDRSARFCSRRACCRVTCWSGICLRSRSSSLLRVSPQSLYLNSLSYSSSGWSSNSLTLPLQGTRKANSSSSYYALCYSCTSLRNRRLRLINLFKTKFSSIRHYLTITSCSFITTLQMKSKEKVFKKITTSLGISK